jgi:spore germination cell wall hydrolase CwlJ-like protein
MAVLRAFICCGLAILFTAYVGLSSGGVAADGVMAEQLTSVLDQERSSVATVSDQRVAQLTTLPADPDRPFLTNPDIIYDVGFIDEMPPADGDAQWQCLAEALYFEARGESLTGQFAVGEVILNRVDSASYPDTPCDVINQGTGRRYACQFSYTCDGIPEIVSEQQAWEQVGKVAQILLVGAPRDLTDGATHYHTDAVNPSWARRFPRTVEIGVHNFYREPVRTAAN